ncbi:xanthine dehydrogenase family protein subunit M [Clostridium sp. CF012]|uniref:FAD binding domain-containing protein n=1 Tax=Clostridium sp. CF012 TaxID=2843319 RepID=UPI001C0CFDA5|nr:FAD binding domain-containing protein [Clostridium sp. CF012]MBU3142980.1 FAD binding domain-containing protein [Clostridium sp. CF012]
MTETFIPKSKEEALGLLNKRKCIILAGGTNLMVKTKKWSGGISDFDSDIVLIKHLQELKNISINKRHLFIGAGCTLAELEENILLPDYFNEIILAMASPTIRNAATIGGNICNVVSEGDILPLLYALDAILIIESLSGTREIAVADFILGPGKKDLKSEELLVEIRIPTNGLKSFYYKKVGTKRSNSLAKASFIGLYILEHERIVDIRMAFGAVGSRVVRSRELENSLKGVNKEELQIILKDLEKEYIKIIAPSDDKKSTAEYSKGICLDLMREFLESIYSTG